MVKRLTASVLIFGLISIGSAQAAKISCFTPEEAKAAHFRTMLQDFNVAALNCRSLDPNDPSVRDRYNVFVSRFGGKLQENAQSLHNHFHRAGGNLDQWMTKVANDAGQRVTTDPQFCQTASDTLDKAMEMAAQDLDGLATTSMVNDRYVNECAVLPPASEAKAKTRKKHKPTKTAAAN